MPTPTDFPDDNAIQAFVVGSGVPLPSGFSFAGYGASAKEALEDRSGYIPFLNANGTVTTRTFDLPGVKPDAYALTDFRGGGRTLPFGAGLLSVSSVTVSGVLLTQDKDYRLMPLNAPARGKPYTWLEFLIPQFGTASAVQVAGVWGFTGAMTDAIYQIALRLGGAMAAKDILQGIFASPTRIKSASGAEINQDSFRDLGTAWEDYANREIEARFKMRTGW